MKSQEGPWRFISLVSGLLVEKLYQANNKFTSNLPVTRPSWEESYNRRMTLSMRKAVVYEDMYIWIACGLENNHIECGRIYTSHICRYALSYMHTSIYHIIYWWWNPIFREDRVLFGLLFNHTFCKSNSISMNFWVLFARPIFVLLHCGYIIRLLTTFNYKRLLIPTIAMLKN